MGEMNDQLKVDSIRMYGGEVGVYVESLWGQSSTPFQDPATQWSTQIHLFRL